MDLIDRFIRKVYNTGYQVKSITKISQKQKLSIINMLQEGETLSMHVKGHTKNALHDILSSVQSDQFSEAINKVKNIIESKINLRPGGDKDVVYKTLQKLQKDIAEINWQSTVVNGYNNGSERLLISSTKVITAFAYHNVLKVIKYTREFGFLHNFLMKTLSAEDLIAIHTEDLHIFDSYEVLKPKFKRYYKKNLTLPSTIEYASSNIIGQIESLERKYPLAKRLHQKESYIKQKGKDFIHNLPELLYFSFEEEVMGDIAKNKIKCIEDVIAKFTIYCLEFSSVSNEGKILGELYMNTLLHEIEEQSQEQHSKKSFCESMAKQHKKIDYSNSVNTIAAKPKPIPEEIIFFADQIGGNAPTSIASELTRYIIRLYRNDKPLVSKHLETNFGLIPDIAISICEMGKKIGFRVESLSLVTEVDRPLDESLIATIEEEKENIIIPMKRDVPKNAQEVYSLLEMKGFFAFQKKKLMKQIQKVLIEDDTTTIRRKKLIFGLGCSRDYRDVKNDKMRSIELSAEYRLLVQFMGGKEYVIGVLDHNAYEACLKPR